MSEIFSKPGDGIYQVSRKIAKMIYNFENDGWCYPSVQHENGINLCLNLESKNKLELIGSSMYQRVEGKVFLAAVFDLNDVNNIQKLDDWNEKDSLAKDTREAFNQMFKECLELNNEAHAKQPKPSLIFKTIILDEKMLISCYGTGATCSNSAFDY